ncbi:hypothetical protein LC76P1_00226 [Lysinibacillus phage LC76P1]|nr:hypothetical protein LC76P1_00226 [Lysinibacillus phage LC76P1]
MLDSIGEYGFKIIQDLEELSKIGELIENRFSDSLKSTHEWFLNPLGETRTVDGFKWDMPKLKSQRPANISIVNERLEIDQNIEYLSPIVIEVGFWYKILDGAIYFAHSYEMRATSGAKCEIVRCISSKNYTNYHSAFTQGYNAI